MSGNGHLRPPGLPLIATPGSSSRGSSASSSPRFDSEQVLSCMQHLPYFQRPSNPYSTEVLKLCLKRITTENFSANDVLFRTGDPSLKWLFLLSGSVTINISSNVTCYVPPSCLSDPAQTRWPGTATAESDCKVAVLQRADFASIVGYFEDRKTEELVEFFQRIPAFARMRKAVIQTIAGMFRLREYVRKQFVYRTGDPADEVYIVKEGEFGLVQSIIARKVTSSVQAMNNFRGGKLAFHRADVALIGPGEFLGDVDVLEDRLRTQTCICKSSKGTVLATSKSVPSTQQYLRMFEENPTNELRDSIEAKSQLREAHIRNIADRIQAMTPIREPGYTILKVTPPPRRRMSFSKARRPNPMLKQLKERILAHEPMLLASTPQPVRPKHELTIQSLVPRRLLLTRDSPISPLNISEESGIPTSYYKLASRRGLIKDELKRAGLNRAATGKMSDNRSFKSPSPETGRVSPILGLGTFMDEEDAIRFGNEWERRKRREGYRRVIRNMKILEVSKRNLCRSKCYLD